VNVAGIFGQAVSYSAWNNLKELLIDYYFQLPAIACDQTSAGIFGDAGLFGCRGAGFLQLRVLALQA
jgi:hypothetical protein